MGNPGPRKGLAQIFVDLSFVDPNRFLP